MILLVSLSKHIKSNSFLFQVPDRGKSRSFRLKESIRERRDRGRHSPLTSWADWNKNLRTTDISLRSGGRIWQMNLGWTRTKSRSGSRTSGPSWRRALVRRANWRRCWRLRDCTITRPFLLMRMKIPFSNRKMKKASIHSSSNNSSSQLVWLFCDCNWITYTLNPFSMKIAWLYFWFDLVLCVPDISADIQLGVLSPRLPSPIYFSQPPFPHFSFFSPAGKLWEGGKQRQRPKSSTGNIFRSW